ncbi:hypothetical protein [Mucilaginibacter sp. L196]|uniref:hypothetical protein n=1 Tax=Mucilaginibacter sp. L196 TaxID=1641870 RepID=UPI00131C37DA|nr:hypothetical protein [Mucilaginibacter sp. L196]
MKNIYKIIGYSVIVFLLSDIIVTLWFVLNIGSSVPHITFNSIVYIFIHYGAVLSTPATISYLIIYALYKKVKIRWTLYLSALIILCCAFFLTAYIFIWYMTAGLLTNDLFVQ